MLRALLVSLFFLTSISAYSEHRIHHRIYHPLHEPTSFEPRGSIVISDQFASFQPSETFPDDLRRFADSLQSLDGAIYQVSLESEGDPIAGHWPFSSVKACHLLTPKEDHLVLHVAANEKPFTIDYFVSPVPHDGACPKLKQSTGSVAFASFVNTTITVLPSKFPPLATLRTPPPLTQDGEPVKPEPEKSFLQKYWMYIAVVLLALVMSGGGEEDPPRGNRN